MSEESKGRLGFKIAIGCAVGCGALVLLAGVAAVGGLYWVFSSGSQVETARVVGEDAVAVVRMDRTTDDPGVRALVLRFFTAAMQAQQRQQREALPEDWRWAHDLSSSQSQPGMLNLYVPRSVTVSFEPGEEEGETAVVAALNLRAFTRMVRMMVLPDADEESAFEYRGHRVDWTGDDFLISFVDGTVVFATELDAMQRAIDRAEAEPSELSPPLAALEPPTDSNWDLWAAAVDRDDDLGSLVAGLLAGRDDEPSVIEDLEPAAAEAPLGASSGALVEDSPPSAPIDSLSRATLGVDVRSDDHLVAEVVFDASDAEAARRWLDRLDEAITQRLGEAADGGLTIEIEDSVDGGHAVATVSVDGLANWVDTAVAEFLASEDF